jgi:tetratricopeptide (TPR) repeat protein
MQQGHIQLNWNDPQELYNTIVSHVMDFPQELEEAAKRQLEIDPNEERSYTIASIVMMKNQKSREARQLLERYLESHKPSAVILTNLAKTYEDDKSKIEILWKAIQLDPNYSSSIDFWLVIIRENEGEEAYYNSLKVLSQLPDTWYPQLYLAREHIENKDLTTTLPLLKHVLNTAPLDSDALLIISGDLGQNGFIQEILDIVLPHYTFTSDNGQHLTQNILQAFYELKKSKEGLAFIENFATRQFFKS